jgi:EAL domain-containing protein (putative c-di-GMP-specific phosphodiesterase class I)
MMRRHEEVHESRVVLDALESDRFALHAQPIVRLAAPKTPTHYEILLRLQGVDGVFLSIGDYLKAAERYQLLERLDRWVVEHTLAMLAPRAAELSALGLTFAINVTGPSLSEPTFADFVRMEVERLHMPGSLLAFEFTETAAVRNLAATQRFVSQMTEMGAKVALDDFGTGLSSLVHLKELAVQQIKIDGQFVRDVTTDTRSEALVRALVQIAEQLGLETVAEFVETTSRASAFATRRVTCTDVRNRSMRRWPSSSRASGHHPPAHSAERAMPHAPFPGASCYLAGKDRPVEPRAGSARIVSLGPIPVI